MNRPLFAKAGERVYGTRTIVKRIFRNGAWVDAETTEEYHHCTVRHDLFIGEIPDFPACLGDFQQSKPPLVRHFIKELENVYTTATVTRTDTAMDLLEDGSPGPFHGRLAFVPVVSTNTATNTTTTFVDLHQHGGGTPPQFGVPWSGESWWREQTQPGMDDNRASVHYDLRFRSPDGTGTWRMDDLRNRGIIPDEPT